MRSNSPFTKWLHMTKAKCICLFISGFFISGELLAQCPPNIDFENGTFSGWKLYTGSVSVDEVTSQNIISLTEVPGPVAGRHQMMNANPGDGLDEYGDFPKNCPNGSNHSIKLGNNQGGNQAEGVSYEFTIPATADKFSIIYNYAIVIQDPGHQIFEQPRLQIEVTNVTDNSPIGCSSFSFVASGGIPGFILSTKPGSNSPVWYKPWAANSINLDGNQGKTIRIFFKTADCTFVSHFGYAYIDVSTECSSSFVGAAYCPQDTAVNISAPFGYQAYKWYNSTYSQVLGTNQVLHLAPPPPNGTNVFVQLTPYAGYGCVDTLEASIVDTLNVTANAGPDKVSCNNAPVQLGVAPVNGLVYSWTPATGLSNPNISNPVIANVTSTISYELSVKSASGGCLKKDTVIVKSDVLDPTLIMTGDSVYCSAGTPAILKVNPSDSVQWYRDGIAIAGATQPQYAVTQSGLYYATLFSAGGCILSTIEKKITVNPSPVAGFGVNNATQCLVGNQFIFTNSSTVTSGTLEYNWLMGDGNSFNTKDATYTYTKSGVFTVTLNVKAAGECIDSKTMTITVLPSPIADFFIKPTCVDLDLPIINSTSYTGTSTVNYLWDFGNTQTSNVANPVYSYSVPGTYVVKLTTSSAQCPQPNTKQINLVIDTPVPGITYPEQTAIFNYPLTLNARNIGVQVLWSPATNLNNPYSFTPQFKGVTEQLYNIRITTASGCVTTDQQLVKTIKKIAINVPTVFTPDGDGNNDYLKPLLYGFRKVNYFRIYNRWGKMLFHMESDTPGWDGKLNNIPQEMQTVVWVIEAEDVDGKMHQAKGTTILMR